MPGPRLTSALALFLLLPLLGGCSPDERPGPVPLRTVKLAPVSRLAAQAPLLPGLVRQPRSAALAFENGGRVLRVAVDVGDRVAAGQLLAEQDAEPARLRLAQANARVQAARVELDQRRAGQRRARQLFADGNLAKAELEAADAALGAAQAQQGGAEAELALARRALAQTRLVAPFAGQIVLRAPEPLRLVGAGETIELVARHLCEHQVKNLIIANRTRERAETLASEVGAEVITLAEIDARLAEADIIISSTSSPLPIIGKGMMERALKARRNKPMLLVDIAVPRDVEPEVGDLPNAYLYSVDDLQAIIEQNLAQRKAAAVQAENIVVQESSEFMAWLRSQGAVNTIREYRSQADEIRAELEGRALQALQQGGDPQKIMQELAHKLTNRLIHAPTKSLQQAARDGDNERLQILRDSLGLD